MLLKISLKGQSVVKLCVCVCVIYCPPRVLLWKTLCLTACRLLLRACLCLIKGKTSPFWQLFFAVCLYFWNLYTGWCLKGCIIYFFITNLILYYYFSLKRTCVLESKPHIRINAPLKFKDPGRVFMHDAKTFGWLWVWVTVDGGILGTHSMVRNSSPWHFH